MHTKTSNTLLRCTLYLQRSLAMKKKISPQNPCGKMTNKSIEYTDLFLNKHATLFISLAQLMIHKALYSSVVEDRKSLVQKPVVFMEVPAEQHKGKMAHAHVLSPIITTTNPENDRSNLYDSFELQAVMKQLNRAIQRSKAPLSPSSYYLNSPSYRRRLDHIYKENVKAPRKISGSMKNNGGVEMMTTARNSKGLRQLWKKVKQTFVVRTKSQES